MTPAERRRLAADILDDFALRTGGASSDRYLWTDAHAVCTWIGLHGQTGDDRFLERALELVDEVHRVLGRHRDDDPRQGRLSGLDDEEGARRPTAGGLRIGKPLPEGPADGAADPQAEWDRDGQYFHYLTRWMHALHRVAVHTGQERYHRWAVELARVAWDAFTVGGGADGPERMVWKMSVDLTRPVVPSMGHHDPLDGLLTYETLQDRTERMEGPVDIPGLEIEIESFEAMCRDRSWATRDPLGVGGLLVDAWREARLVSRGRSDDTGRLKWLCREAWRSLEMASGEIDPRGPPERRLAFREMGLSLGLHAVERLARLAEVDDDLAGDDALAVRVESLGTYLPLAEALERSWLDPAAREASTWTEHENINAVSLATSLAPEGWLG